VREKRVEQELSRSVKDVGGWCVKILPSVAGLPDRLVLFPDGRIFFVELKSPTGVLSPRQHVIHNRLGTLGHTVIVLRTPEQVTEWVSLMDNTAEPL